MICILETFIIKCFVWKSVDSSKNKNHRAAASSVKFHRRLYNFLITDLDLWLSTVSQGFKGFVHCESRRGALVGDQ